MAEEALDLEGEDKMKDFWCIFWKNLKSILKVYLSLGSFIGAIALLVYVCNILMDYIGVVFTVIVMGVFITIVGILANTALEVYWEKKGYR